VTQWVLEDDLVPRMLGSEYPVLQALASSWLPDDMQEDERLQLLDQLAGYVHINAAEVRLLREGKAYSVPATARRQVLHVHGALLSLVLNGAWHSFLHHSIYSYVDRIKELLNSSRTVQEWRWAQKQDLRRSSHTDF